VYLFGDAIGDPVADEILAQLRRAENGLNRTQIRELCGNHVRADRIGQALGVLLRAGLARTEQRETGGRPAEVWFGTKSGGQPRG
jgi:hypothetical protein